MSEVDYTQGRISLPGLWKHPGCSRPFGRRI